MSVYLFVTIVELGTTTLTTVTFAFCLVSHVVVSLYE